MERGWNRNQLLEENMCREEFLGQEKKRDRGKKVGDHAAKPMQDREQTPEKGVSPLYIHCTNGIMHLWCGEPQQIQLGTILIRIMD